MKIKIEDNSRFCLLLFLLGLLAGAICRATDFFPYESLWSLPSMATLFGFWIASVGAITYCSSSGWGALIHSFLYMFGMTVSFYGTKYLLGLFLDRFSGEFPTKLFLIYSAMSVLCGVGSGLLFFWNRRDVLGSVLCALPAAGLLAEGLGCLAVLLSRRMLLGQTLFDFAAALIFGVLLYRKAASRTAYFLALAAVTAGVFFMLYRPFLA